jgi:hypothetical protein
MVNFKFSFMCHVFHGGGKKLYGFYLEKGVHGLEHLGLG